MIVIVTTTINIVITTISLLSHSEVIDKYVLMMIPGGASNSRLSANHCPASST